LASVSANDRPISGIATCSCRVLQLPTKALIAEQIAQIDRARNLTQRIATLINRIASVGAALQVGGGVTATLTRQVSLYGDIAWQSHVGNAGGFRGSVANGGLRSAFGASPSTPQAPVVSPACAAARSYLLFFPWDKVTLTDRARQIIREAADNSTDVQYTRIEVNGYTDTSGTAKYNQGRSARRAEAVAADLVRDGVPPNVIAIAGFGQTHLLDEDSGCCRTACSVIPVLAAGDGWR
jgi:hypothetical protein